jgi:hypothetical protein
VGSTEAGNIVWTMENERSPTINPVAPGDELAMSGKFPGFGIRFSLEGIKQMVGIIDQMKKATEKMQQQPKSK